MRYYISIQDLGTFLMGMPLSTKYRKYLFIIEPVQVDGISVIPGHLLHVVLEPQILAQAERAAARVNHLSGRQVAHPVQVEVQNEDAVVL